MRTEGKVPVVSVKALVNPALPSTDPSVLETSRALLNAAKEWGFVYITDHAVSKNLLDDLESASKTFFQLPLAKKMKLRMSLGKKAWRGYFPPGGELTSGIPDQKEGFYFGTELANEHPKVKCGTPLHGQNLWPDDEVPQLRPTILEYLTSLTGLGHALMRGFAIGLELNENYFKESFGNDPTILFRIFNYPQSDQVEGWGVEEHTDYGFLTMLKTDEHSGLQILSPNQEWIDAPPMPDAFIINLGDQLEIATQGLLKATPHRVKIQREGDRLSWPFFFDPDWDARLKPVSIEESRVLRDWVTAGGNDSRKVGTRWDGKDLRQEDPNKKYGEYLMEKVSKCFPDLFSSVV